MCQHHAIINVGDGPLGVCRECGKLVPSILWTSTVVPKQPELIQEYRKGVA